MLILTEAAGKVVNTLILLPTHSSAEVFEKSDITLSSKNAEMLLKTSKILFSLFIPLFIPLYIHLSPLHEKRFDGHAVCTSEVLVKTSCHTSDVEER